VYHVENFLLEPTAIREAAAALAGKEVFENDATVMEALKQSAADIVNSLIVEELQAEIRAELLTAIKVGAAPDTTDVATEILPSIESSLARVAATGADYTLSRLQERVDAARSEMEAYLESGEWAKRYPGRRILRRFVGEHLPTGVGYEPFRNVVMEKMALSERRPENMEEVLNEILAA
jgi:hypothetical protein